MNTEIIPLPSSPSLRALIARAGERRLALPRILHVNIRNKNTRAAHGQAAGAFLRWCRAGALPALRTTPQATEDLDAIWLPTGAVFGGSYRAAYRHERVNEMPGHHKLKN